MSIFLALAALWNMLVFAPSPQMLEAIVHGGSTSGGSSNTFTLVQHVGLVSGVSATGPSGNGNAAIIIITADSGSDFVVSSLSGGGTWTEATACHGGSASAGYLRGFYNLNTSTAGSVTINLSSGTVSSNSIWEYTPSGTPHFDNSGTCSIGSGNPINGCTPSFSGSNVVNVQGVSISAGGVNSVSTYGNILIHNGAFAAEADFENTASTSVPVWTLSGAASAQGCVVTLK